MLCCSLGAVLIATTTLSGKRLRAPFRRRLLAQSALVTTMASALLILSASGAQHLGHYLDRARANERGLLAEIMAQPICTGAPSGALARPTTDHLFDWVQRHDEYEGTAKTE
jgi:hypothetical protein